MKDPTPAPSPSRSPSPSRPTFAFDAGKGKYKAWALGAILLLAFWSMLTGTVSLNFSSSQHNHGLLLPSDDLLDSPLRPTLDILEMEEREKVVVRTWEIYLHNKQQITLPSFWREAFEAAYQDLAGDDEMVKEEAVREIARMSLLRMVDLDNKEEKEKSGSDINKARKLIAL